MVCIEFTVSGDVSDTVLEEITKALDSVYMSDAGLITSGNIRKHFRLYLGLGQEDTEVLHLKLGSPKSVAWENEDDEE